MKLVLNNIEIITMEELRENFDEADVMKAFVNGSLEMWLRSIGYDVTADKVKVLIDTEDYSYSKVCDILVSEHPLVAEIREELSREFCDDFYLPHSFSAFKYDYPSRYTAELTRKELAEDICYNANKFFNPDYPECISAVASEFYGRAILKMFKKWGSELKRLSERAGKLNLFAELEQKICKSEARLKRIFEDELNKNKEFCEFVSVDKLTDKIHIKEFDYRTESGILRLIEGFVPGKFEYMLDNFWDVVFGLQKDVDCLVCEFKRIAYEEYNKFALGIEGYVKEIV